MPDILLKERTENDSEFFMELFGEIKSSELHLDTWPEQIRHQMIVMQFQAFEKYMKAEFPESVDFLITYQSENAGRLQLNKNEEGIRIINISLLPSFRNLGIGSAIIQDILSESNSKGISVYLEVDKINPALNLYSRLGFKIIGENEIKYSMIYSPEKN
jgi:ribosomal protein S18 acetylase RimI-like enzyme